MFDNAHCTLSRRVEPTPTQAVFTYSYGDFPGDPLKLLAKHYDVMLYLANWGSKQLAFRFPKAAIDEQSLQPYGPRSGIIRRTAGSPIIV